MIAKYDPRALQVARLVQQREQPELTILFGSRARGDYHELESDIDVLLVQAVEPTPDCAAAAVRAAERDTTDIYGHAVPVQLIWRTLKEFRYNRRYVNSIETQAVKQGVVMALDPGEYSPSSYEDEETDYDYDWSIYSERLRHAEQHLDAFVFLSEGNMSDLVIGQQAQNALEHGMKALLEAHRAPYRRVHNIGELLGNVRHADPEMRDFRLAIPPEVYSEYAGDLAYNRREQPELSSYPDFIEITRIAIERIIARAREVRGQRENSNTDERDIQDSE